MPDLSLVIQIAKSAAELAGDFLNQQQNKTHQGLDTEMRVLSNMDASKNT